MLISIFGINFNVFVYCNGLLLAAAQGFAIAATKFRNFYVAAIAPVGILLVGFHPAQTNHLLWPFEIGWFNITCCLMLNCWLTEQFGKQWLLAVAVSALVASFSGAHGMFLWAVVALHVYLKYGWREGRAWICAFLLAFAIWATIIAKLTPPGEAKLSLSQFPELVHFFLGLLGGTAFAVRDETIAVALGIALLFLVATLVLIWLWRGVSAPADRVGLTLMCASLLMMSAFTLGRYPYGLVWAFGYFHSGTQLMPLLMGMLLVALSLLDRPNEGRRGAVRLAAAVCAGFVITSVMVAVPYAVERGGDSKTERAVAMYYTCRGETSQYLLDNLNGFDENTRILLYETRSFLGPVCGQPMPERAQLLVAQPPEFDALARTHPSYAGPLEDLWEVYVASSFLRHAYWIGKPGAAMRVLSFAEENARAGTKYYADKLKPDESVFRDLDQQ